MKPKNPYQKDFSMATPPEMRIPWKLTPHEHEIWVDIEQVIFDFTKNFDISHLKTNNGWEFRADSKNKYGLIATEENAKFSMELEFNLENTNIMVGFLSSYENISPVHVWFDNDKDDLCNTCNPWDCTCQEFSNYFGTQPGLWGCAKEVSFAREFWHSHKCTTKSEVEINAGCKNGFPLGKIASDAQFHKIKPLRKESKVSVYNSHLVKHKGKGKHVIYFCLPKSSPYQKFKLLQLSYSKSKLSKERELRHN
jgi:hypothetical protein